MRRFAFLLPAFALLLIVACGGGDDDDSDDGADGGRTGTPAATETAGGDSSGGGSVSVGDGSNSDFCSPNEFDFVQNVFDFDRLQGAELEQQLAGLSDLLDEWADRAPGEIRGDVEVVAAALQEFYGLLQEYDFDFFAIAQQAPDDPRFANLDRPEFTEAADRISAYCGFDLGAPTGQMPGSGDAMDDGGGSSIAGLPDGFPEALIPPDSAVFGSTDIGAGVAAQFTSTASLEELRAFYDAALGPGQMIDADNYSWTVIDGSGVTSVTVGSSDVTRFIGVSVIRN